MKQIPFLSLLILSSLNLAGQGFFTVLDTVAEHQIDLYIQDVSEKAMWIYFFLTLFQLHIWDMNNKIYSLWNI